MSRRPIVTLLFAILLGLQPSIAPPAVATAGGGIGVRVSANPLAVELSLSARDVLAGTALSAFVTATNLGADPLTKVRYDLLVDASGLKVSAPVGGATTLGPHEHSTATFVVCAIRPGSYVVVGSVSAQTRLHDGFTATTAGQLLVVRPTNARPKCK
jgi:hypothetical protein